MARAVHRDTSNENGPNRKFFTLLSVQLLTVLLLAVLADGLIWLATTESITFTQEGEIQLLDLEGGSYKRCSLENGYYSTDDSSPQILLKAPADQPVEGIIIHLSQPLAQDTTIRVYYTKKGEKQSNDHSERITAYAGLTELALNIPADQYNHLRFRIKGNMYLDRITVSEGATVQQLRSLTFRWIRILAIFLPLALFLCLYRFLPDFRTAMQTVYGKVIRPDTRWKGISIGYGIFACAMILSNIYRMIYWKNGLSYTPGAFPFEIPWYVFAILGILLGRMWKTKTFWIFLILLAWQYYRLAIPDYAAAMSVRDYFLNSLYLYFGCFSIGRVLPPAKNKWFISLACITWTGMMLVYDGFGLYTAWTGTVIPNLGGSSFEIAYDRLYGIYRSMVCGVLAGVSAAMLLIGIHLTRRKSIRLTGILAFLVIVITGALSSARAGYVLVAFALASVFCVHFYERLFPDGPGIHRTDRKGNPGGTFLRRVTVCLLFIGILVGATLIQDRIVTVFVMIREKGGLISNAMAEAATGSGSIQPRVYDLNSPDAFLSGRITIWNNFFQVLRENPLVRIWGESVYNPMRHMDALRRAVGRHDVSHCHNELFQMILESGIPGGVLYVCFILSVVIPAVKVLFTRRLPMWMRLFPLPMLCCFLAETVDCTCKISTMHPQTTLLYLFAGLTLAASEYARKTKPLIPKGEKHCTTT